MYNNPKQTNSYYGNKKDGAKSSYNKDNNYKKNNYNQSKVDSKPKQQSYNPKKDDDDEYTVRQHAKKIKPKNEFYNMDFSEGFLLKENGRKKRENDQKHKKYRG